MGIEESFLSPLSPTSRDDELFNTAIQALESLPSAETIRNVNREKTALHEAMGTMDDLLVSLGCSFNSSWRRSSFWRRRSIDGSISTYEPNDVASSGSSVVCPPALLDLERDFDRASPTIQQLICRLSDDLDSFATRATFVRLSRKLRYCRLNSCGKPLLIDNKDEFCPGCIPVIITKTVKFPFISRNLRFLLTCLLPNSTARITWPLQDFISALTSTKTLP